MKQSLAVKGLAEALGFDPEAVLVNDPGVLLNARFLAALHTELREELGAEAAPVALLQIGLLHGLRDAARVVGPGHFDPREPGLPASAPPLAIRFRSNPDASPRGALELHGSWPERAEASACLSSQDAEARGSSGDAASCCWLSAGYTSGWLSGVFEADILALEASCSAAGSESCRFVARELDAWRASRAPEASELLDLLPYDAFRELVARRQPMAHPTPDEMDPGDAAINIWGPVMVIPFSGADEALLALELIGRDPGAAEVSVVVIDLTGVVLDEAFGAAALEQILERVDAWGIEALFAGVSSLSEPVVQDLQRAPLLVEKDLHSAIAAAFQIARAQRTVV